MNLEEFYNYLYFIGFKILLVDNKTWVKISNKYSVKVKLLTDMNTELPSLTIMVVDDNGLNVYEHSISVSKFSEIRGETALGPIIRKCSNQEKLEYINKKDSINDNKPYNMCYMPINISPISREVFQVVQNFYLYSLRDLNIKVKAEKETHNQKKLMFI